MNKYIIAPSIILDMWPYYIKYSNHIEKETLSIWCALEGLTQLS
jgi:hypothetical protein